MFGVSLFPVTVFLSFAALLWFKNLTSLIVAALAYMLLFVVCLMAAVISLAYFLGWLKITCPLCGRDGNLTGSRRYTYFVCRSCGDVHAKGVLLLEFRAEKKDKNRRNA